MHRTYIQCRGAFQLCICVLSYPSQPNSTCGELRLDGGSAILIL
jgi:hypothetical protein